MQTSTNKPTFTMLVGLPGSGKSTYAAEQHEKYGVHVCSSDAIRKELAGDENSQENNEDVFKLLHKRVKEYLKNGESVIYDATNVKSKRRRAFLKELKYIPCEKVCIIFRTPYDICVANQTNRDRKVPEEVIRGMYMKWDTPYWFEGWDNIYIKNGYDINNYPDRLIKTPRDFIYTYAYYSQDNEHHKLGLGDHCLYTAKLIDGGLVLRNAAAIHDCGKPFSKTYVNMKGELTANAHYYGHEHIGAYEALFYEYPGIHELDVSILVNLHMIPYGWEKEKDNGTKTREKYRKIWGDKLYGMVLRLHEADKMAH